ncbi:hypothetical protein [Rhizobium oryzicola]|uniref:Uncharacterized protein n=1 Tax=Rhizobium oryzicola TaxID=1232668 RepID=A0ABT8SVQ8_9HYPH|nr:hypothetical protein [Rhizobium oryzicola]MDO1582527.1 hypothetical protein [Rhizobium oryzicola]
MRNALLGLAVCTQLSPFPAIAEESPTAWQIKKCQIYQDAWKKARSHFPFEAVSQEFIQSNEAFIASGCLASIAVCPQTPVDFKLANALTVAAMKGGTASSFLPFKC